jgi:hypothetical protein
MRTPTEKQKDERVKAEEKEERGTKGEERLSSVLFSD